MTTNNSRKSKKVKKRYLSVICFFLLAADLITKYWAQSVLETAQKKILIFEWFQLHFLRNNISDLEKLYAFAVLIILVSAIMWARNWSVSLHPLWYPGAFLILTGILGNNVIDTLYFGYIRDFLHVPGLGTGNFADQYRYVGVVLMLIALFTDKNNSSQ